LSSEELGGLCDVVFVAVPVAQIARSVIAIAGSMAPGGVITDAGSVKTPVLDAVRAALPDGVSFVGGHPMAGAEHAGVDAARPDLFRDAVWVLTPDPSTNAEAVATVMECIRSFGAEVLTLDPQSHDAAVATISHLPQVAASALMNVAARRASDAPPVLRIAAGGFRDVTRIAAGSPSVWVDILAGNASQVRGVLDAYIAELQRFRDHLADAGELTTDLEEARAARRSLPVRELGDGVWNVLVDVEDRPGVLAEVMTTIGEAGINIVDVALRHSPEGGGGELRLSVDGDDPSARAVALLASHGFAVLREEVGE
jgi:prephenate dehydrogenase